MRRARTRWPGSLLRALLGIWSLLFCLLGGCGELSKLPPNSVTPRPRTPSGIRSAPSQLLGAFHFLVCTSAVRLQCLLVCIPSEQFCERVKVAYVKGTLISVAKGIVVSQACFLLIDASAARWLHGKSCTRDGGRRGHFFDNYSSLKNNL